MKEIFFFNLGLEYFCVERKVDDSKPCRFFLHSPDDILLPDKK
jgi:hypothetical protein